MFTLSQIQNAHSKVRSGTDFPLYIQDLITLGVTQYKVSVSDGRTIYHGNPEPLDSGTKYSPLEIGRCTNKKRFIEKFKLHQSGKTDYMTFCRDCAENGIDKWILDTQTNTCTYYDFAENIVLTETLP